MSDDTGGDDYKSMAVKLSLWAQARGVHGASPAWLTKLAHHFASRQNPKLIAQFIRDYKINYTQATQCSSSNSVDECALKYGTLSDFFTRKIRGIRIGESPLVSPATCKVTAFDVFGTSKIWVKGRRWSAERLLRDPSVSLQNFGVGIFRLRPQDYHRFHSPFRGVIKSVKHISGGYLSVDPVVVGSRNVFTENNRVVIEVSTLYGTCYVVPVGAAGVGKVYVFPRVGEVVMAGDELGTFDFGGSTVVVLIPFTGPPIWRRDLVAASMQAKETYVRVGDPVGI